MPNTSLKVIARVAAKADSVEQVRALLIWGRRANPQRARVPQLPAAAEPSRSDRLHDYRRMGQGRS
jgi:hypothetical protein